MLDGWQVTNLILNIRGDGKTFYLLNTKDLPELDST